MVKPQLMKGSLGFSQITHLPVGRTGMGTDKKPECSKFNV
jgi:hypothetical protein